MDDDDIVAEYAEYMSADIVDPVLLPFHVETDSYDEFDAIRTQIGATENVSWSPIDAGRAFADATKVDLSHLEISLPVTRIDATFNGMMNSGSLVGLAVIDPGEVGPHPFELPASWNGSMLRHMFLNGPCLLYTSPSPRDRG